MKMQTIFKYPVSDCKMYLPKGAVILHAGFQNQTEPRLFIWVRHNEAPDAELEVREFKVVATGQRDIDPSWQYIDTAAIDGFSGALVLHVFEVKTGAPVFGDVFSQGVKP